MKILKIVVDELPKNCVDCPNVNCSLPTKEKRPDQIKKAYLTKRHPECKMVVEK